MSTLRTGLTLALVAAIWAPSASTAQPKSLEPRSLHRRVDTVVIQGAALGKMIGESKHGIRAYVCRAGYMMPIQFQIDEKNAKGTYCWDAGDPERRIRDEDKGLIDKNDELVVLARDAGDRAFGWQIKTVPGSTKVQEIQLTCPLKKGRAWIYLYSFPKFFKAPRLTLDLARLKIKNHKDGTKTHSWYGEKFMFNNDKARMNAVRATYAGLSPNGDYRKVPSMLDSTQVKAVVSFMWVTVTRQSNDIKVTLGGLIDGPIRVVAESRIKVYLAMGFWVSAPDSYLILWHNKMSMPTNAQCPVNLDQNDHSYYDLCMDMDKRLAGKGWKFYNSRNKTPVDIDGRISKAERELDRRYPDWNAVYGPRGALISKFVIPPFLAKRKRSKLIYVDDEFIKRPNDEEGLEFQKGCFGLNGYHMDMRGLKKGLYPGDYIVWYAPPPFKPGDEQAYLDEYDDPVEAQPTQAAK